MKTLLTLFLLLFLAPTVASAQTIQGFVKDRRTGEALQLVAVQVDGAHASTTDSLGYFLVTGLKHQRYKVGVELPGYEAESKYVDLVKKDSAFIRIFLIPKSLEVADVVVTGTRTERSIEDVPVRVEAIPEGEIAEEMYMQPSNVAMLLGESTGLRVQTTSGTSGTSNLRMQGLPGRYTQILENGIPSFGGLSSGFSLTQIPPLNLRQVEILKGSGSVLYGSDAIGGVINFLTKQPGIRTWDFLFNATSQGAYDAAQFFSSISPGVGIMLSGSRQPAVDLDNDGFTDVPKFLRYNGNASVDLLKSKIASLQISAGANEERRQGGVVNAPDSAIGKPSPYVELNENHQFRSNVRFKWNADTANPDAGALQVNLAGMSLDRESHYGDIYFAGRQWAGYTDAQYNMTVGAQNLLLGSAFSFDQFRQRSFDPEGGNSYILRTPGVFLQDEITLFDKLHIVAGGRADWNNVYGWFFTPRVSALYKFNPTFSIRASRGLGWKAPTIFVEELEERGFYHIEKSGVTTAERSTSSSIDVSWRAVLGELASNINLAGFWTDVANALVVETHQHGPTRLNEENHLLNATGLLSSRGVEFMWNLSFDEFQLLSGYTYTYVTQNHRKETYELPLTPRHAANFALVWDIEDIGLRISAEHYIIGSQSLRDFPGKTRSPAYSLTGALIQKRFGKLTVFLNFENIFDERQTKHDAIVRVDPVSGDVYPLPVYMPNEGRVINGGIRFPLEELLDLMHGED